VRRDIAFVVDQTIAAQTLLDELQKTQSEAACRHIQQVALFDEFRPKTGVSGGLEPHQKSLAFRITLQDTGGTLQDETVDLAIKTLVDRMARVYGARLRGVA
jgi:phenylalanyl-tRNA synthetase beta chain